LRWCRIVPIFLDGVRKRASLPPLAWLTAICGFSHGANLFAACSLHRHAACADLNNSSEEAEKPRYARQAARTQSIENATVAGIPPASWK
jgi:hypothetical protein